jgi:hypothetical protein
MHVGRRHHVRLRKSRQHISALATVSRGRGACNTLICTKVVAHHFRPRKVVSSASVLSTVSRRHRHQAHKHVGRRHHVRLHKGRRHHVSSTKRSSAAFPPYRRSAAGGMQHGRLQENGTPLSRTSTAATRSRPHKGRRLHLRLHECRRQQMSRKSTAGLLRSRRASPPSAPRFLGPAWPGFS